MFGVFKSLLPDLLDVVLRSKLICNVKSRDPEGNSSYELIIGPLCTGIDGLITFLVDMILSEVLPITIVRLTREVGLFFFLVFKRF